MAGPLVVGKLIKAGADAFDYKLPSWAEKGLDPIGTAKDYLSSKVESALDLPKDSVALATDPGGFAKGIAKDLVKDKIKDEFIRDKEAANRELIPVEDRSFESTGYNKPDMENMEWEGGYKRGGKVKAKAKAMPKASTASRRGDGIAQRGKTKGRYL